MRWLAVSPIILGVVMALAQLAISLLVERAEAKRRLRHPARSRDVFRPVVIQGGKAQAPPEPEPRESRIA
jgi:hypothetical protein